MGKLIVINGSPRGGRSNTRLYSEAMASVWPDEYVVYNVVRRQPVECLKQLEGCTDILLAFPLYTDGLPSGLVELLGRLLEAGIDAETRVHVLVNCGFREPSQCAVALEIGQLFCKRAGCRFGGSLCIGCGEAFPGTPLMRIAERKLRRFAREIVCGNSPQWTLKMPLTRGLFIRVADDFWLRRAGNLTRAQLEARHVEPDDADTV